MFKYKKFIIFSIMLIVLSVTSINTSNDGNLLKEVKISVNNRSTATFHEAIHIIGDGELADAAAESGGGYGNSTHPFIIEQWLIVSASNNAGIYIEDTTAYFIIQDCSIDLDDRENSAAIHIENVSIKEPSLESVFLRITGYELRD